MATTPLSAPETAPANPAVAPAEKITLDAKDKLADLKSKLEIKTDDPAKQKEIAKIEEFFKQKKDEILTISKASLDSLRNDIHDSDEVITGKIKVKDGELVHTEAPASAESETAAPETPQSEAETADQLTQIKSQVPPEYQKEVKNYVVDNGWFAGVVRQGISNWIVEIIKWIKGFFATFGIEDEGEKKDALAQINGFEDAEEERRVTASVKALKSSPITKWPPLSDVIKIGHISNEDLTQILKDNPALDFSSNKNIEAAFSGSFLPSEQASKMRYLRIYTLLGDFHASPRPEYKPKEIFTDLLSGHKNTDLDDRIPERESASPPAVTSSIWAAVEEVSTSSEIQTQDIIDARKLDTDLQKSRDELFVAKAISPATEESKKKITEAEVALKPYQEKIDILKKSEKWIMMETLKETNISLETLKAQKTVLEAKEPENTKEIAENQTQIDFYEKNKASIMEKINSVMITAENDSEKWNFQDTKTANDIVTARIGIQSIMEQTPISATEAASENQEPETEKLSQEIAILSQEIEKNAQAYSEATTTEGKAALKKTAEDKLKSLQEKNTVATGINKTIQENYAKQPDKARRSESAMKEIKISLENAQKSIKKIETEGTSELESLSCSDRNNLLYRNGKLYQFKEPGAFYEMVYKEGNLQQAWDAITELAWSNKNPRTAQKLWYKIVPYNEAKEVVSSIDDIQRNIKTGWWIYVAPEHFSGKLRNPKID